MNLQHGSQRDWKVAEGYLAGNCEPVKGQKEGGGLTGKESDIKCQVNKAPKL